MVFFLFLAPSAMFVSSNDILVITGDVVVPAFCPKCWKELPEGMETCPTCGMDVTLGMGTQKWSDFRWQMALDRMVYGLIAAFVIILAVIAVLWIVML